MISHDNFKGVWNRNKFFRDSIKNTINQVIPTVDYSGIKYYKHGSITTKKNQSRQGVLYLHLDKWVWSWINSINTNYSSIYLIIEFISKKEKVDLSEMEFSTFKLENTLKFIRCAIENYKQDIFRPGSEVFRKMFFTTQFTWTKGSTSTIVFLHSISKKFDIKYNLSFERGDEDDMMRGIDYLLLIDGGTKKVQHKSAKLEDEGLYFTSKSLLYNESIYRNGVDLFSIQSGKKIYIIENSKDETLIGVRNQKFFVLKSQIIHEMDIKNDSEELEDLLIELSQICFNNQFIFMFERTEEGDNEFLISDENGVKTIRLILNDLEDKNLLQMIRNKVEELKNLL